MGEWLDPFLLSYLPFSYSACRHTEMDVISWLGFWLTFNTQLQNEGLPLDSGDPDEGELI